MTQTSLIGGGEQSLRGRVTRIIFANEETGFAICRFDLADGREEVIAGDLFDVHVDEELEVVGGHEETRHGTRFRVRSYQPILPNTPAGIARYLASGVVPGIGKVMAERIVRHFGAETLPILDDDPKRLMEVEGIGAKRGASLASVWSAKRNWRELVVFLQSVGVPRSLAGKIVKHYGEDAIRRLKANPYELALDVKGIGFTTADKIAGALGIEHDSIDRAQAGLVHILSSMAEEGHTGYVRGGLCRTCADQLGIDEHRAEEALDRLRERGLIVVDAVDANDEPTVFLKDLYEAEAAVVRGLRGIRAGRSRLREFDATRAIDWLAKKKGIDLSPTQSVAVGNALRDKVAVITGGPGTGKTTIIRAIVEITEALKGRVVLAAPTGRAAKRLSEACGREAKTLHRLLEIRPGAGARFSAARLDPDVLVVDEAGMIDVQMMATIAMSIASHTHLIIVGDVDQLPSVGPGSVLRDLIECGEIPVARLTEIFRQAQRSLIVTNAHRIRRGQEPVLTDDAEADFFFIQRDNPEGAQNTIVDLVTRRLPNRYGLDPLADIQVLTPMHKGDIGVRRLNECLQLALNPSGAELRRGERIFRVRDRVLQMSNDYDRGVFNGDLGRVSYVDATGRFLNVDFDGVTVKVEGAQFDDLALAYATSIHKSQGSEYPAVVVALSTQHFVLLQRNLLYTAVTRAKRLVVIVGSRRALELAIRNDDVSRRYGLLAERLRRALSSHALSSSLVPELESS